MEEAKKEGATPAPKKREKGVTLSRRKYSELCKAAKALNALCAKRMELQNPPVIRREAEKLLDLILGLGRKETPCSGS